MRSRRRGGKAFPALSAFISRGLSSIRAVPAHIRRKSPEARVLASLRDPVERLYSHYLMMRNNLPGFGSFRQEIERGLSLQGLRNVAFLDPAIGLYSRQVERYRNEFGRRFKVIVFEEWTRDTPRTLRRYAAEAYLR